MHRLIASLIVCAALPASAVEFPVRGKSLGGVVRAAPSMDSRRLGALRPNESITIVKKTDVVMNDYAWFQIAYHGRTAYQWGGIMCSASPVEHIFQTCP